MELRDVHKRWIAQSEAWRSSIEFRLPVEEIPAYSFLKRKTDLYIATLGVLAGLLDNGTLDEQSPELFEAVATALEIYSIPTTAPHFHGVDADLNLLLVASAYYLANYPASALLISKSIHPHENWTEIEAFIHLFLLREVSQSNPYMTKLAEYLSLGEQSILTSLIAEVASKKLYHLQNDPEEYVAYKLAEGLLRQFYQENIWSDLLPVALPPYWKELVDHMVGRRIWSLFPSQRAAVKSGLFTFDSSMSLQMPTSSGKTALSKLLIYHQMKESPTSKVLFLAPFRALASELNRDLVTDLKEFGIKTFVMYGGKEKRKTEQLSLDDYNVIISTPEKFLAGESQFSDILPQITTVICDEGHLLDDRQRGLNYELLLTRLKKGASGKRRFLFVSAIVPNLQDVNQWLGGGEDGVCRSDYRPTKLEFAYARRVRKRQVDLEVNPLNDIPIKYFLHKFVRDDDFKFVNKRTNRTNTYGGTNPSQKTISVMCTFKLLPTGTVALFSPEKGTHRGVEGLAAEVLAQLDSKIDLPKPVEFADPTAVGELVEYFTFTLGEDYSLTRLANTGALFHHGDLPQFIREVVERAIVAEDVRLLICTNTVAEGVNLPIRSIVLHSMKRFAGLSEDGQPQFQPLRVRDVKNLIGRAGRAGRSTKGLIVLANPQEVHLLNPIIQGQPSEQIDGALLDVVHRISEYIVKHQLQITNELLESGSERLLELIDGVDSSLINLMGENIDPSDLEREVESLVLETFAYFKGNNDDKASLSSLFAERAKRITKFHEEKGVNVLRITGASIRTFEYLTSNLDFNDAIWITASSPLDPGWLDIIKKCAFAMPQLQFAVKEYNQRTKLEFGDDELLKIVTLWISGKWYPEISESVNCSVDDLLKLFPQVILFRLFTACQVMIKLAEEEVSKNGMEISEPILQWTRYLEHGVHRSLDLQLLSWGLYDRAAVLVLCDWLEGFVQQPLTTESLRMIWLDRTDVLKEYVSSRLPTLSRKRLREFLDDLS